MAVGAGSIKRASKLNAEAAEPKKAAEAKADKQAEVKADTAEVKETPKGTKKVKTATKSAAAKPAATKEATAKKTASSKTSASKTAAAKAETTVNVMVPTPEVMQEVVKIASAHQACHLTEDLPIHLL